MWQLAQQHCPASLLQVTRQNTDAATASAALSNPVQITTLLASLGPTGFLATATQGPAPLIQTNYASVKTAGKVTPVLDGLPRGSRLGTQTGVNLCRAGFNPPCGGTRCRFPGTEGGFKPGLLPFAGIVRALDGVQEGTRRTRRSSQPPRARILHFIARCGASLDAVRHARSRTGAR